LLPILWDASASARGYKEDILYFHQTSRRQNLERTNTIESFGGRTVAGIGNSESLRNRKIHTRSPTARDRERSHARVPPSKQLRTYFNTDAFCAAVASRRNNTKLIGFGLPVQIIRTTTNEKMNALEIVLQVMST
jgi:hypothetical protein